MSFRRRTFPEILDNVLTSVTAGVAAESHPFPPPGAAGRHALERPPVGRLISVYGSRGGESHLFRQGSDYALGADGASLEWLDGAELPDPETLVHVNYYPSAALPVLTDIQTGSVVRTLSETVALEIARLEATLEAVWRAGFIDTAEGSALDNVVALLGVERIRAGHAAGEVELGRAPGSRGAVNVPAGTRVLNEDGSVEYETTAAVTLAPGQDRVRVSARDLEVNEPLPAGALTVLAVPLAGIASVTNPAPTAFANRDETDGELRERSRDVLSRTARATPSALREALVRQGVDVDVHEPGDRPGRVEVTPFADKISPELRQRLLAAIEEARPAGVVVELAGARAPRRVDLELRLTTRSELLEQDVRGIHLAVAREVEDFFARLPAGENASLNRLVNRVMNVSGVEDVRVARATVDGGDLDLAGGELALAGFPTVLGELVLTDPNLPTRLDAVVRYPSGAAAPDAAALESVLGAALAAVNAAVAAAGTAPPPFAFAKLLFAIPLPGKAVQLTPAEVDARTADGTLPALPDVSPYEVRFVFTQAAGLTRELSAPGDAYPTGPFERFVLAGATVEEVPG